MRLFVLLPVLLCSSYVSAERILPDTCGKDNVKFNVEKQATPAPLPASELASARIVFIKTYESHGVLNFFSEHMLRYGVDGNWVAAGRNNSYTFADVPPGEHHFCIAYENDKSDPKTQTFTAEAGKTYYFVYSTLLLGHGQSGWTRDVAFKQIEDDLGKYKVKTLPYATFKPKS